MSTILDALRKVEREREPTSGATIDGPTISPDVRRRRPFPVVAVLICAVIGFSGGALLSWWVPTEKTSETAAVPVPPRAPDIAVPRAPVHAKAHGPSAPAQVAKGSGQAEPAVGPVPHAVAPAVSDAGVTAPPAPPSAASAPVTAPMPPEVPAPAPERDAAALAAVDKGSALEPSPFGAARETSHEGAHPTAPNVAQKESAVESAAVAQAPAGERHEDREVAALTPPPPPEAAEAETNLENTPEPEAEPPAETIFDTGRSPPGAPKVALSFLQWSADPARRFAFISIDGAPSQRVREGEVAAGLTVAAITPTGVQFKREGTIFVIRPRH